MLQPTRLLPVSWRRTRASYSVCILCVVRPPLIPGDPLCILLVHCTPFPVFEDTAGPCRGFFLFCISICMLQMYDLFVGISSKFCCAPHIWMVSHMSLRSGSIPQCLSEFLRMGLDLCVSRRQQTHPCVSHRVASNS